MFPLLILATLTLSGCVFKKEVAQPYQVDLEVWGVFDDSDAYQQIFNDYKAMNPYVKDIRYRKLAVETYKDDLINALASGKGPDIFMFRNAWRRSFEDKLAPAPEGLLTQKEFQDAFVDVATYDFIGTENKIFGVPLSVDSLALYYNKDIFNAAGISQPPETWEEMLEIIPRLNRVDGLGNITQSAVSLGTAQNVNRSTDILSLLMLQLGSQFGKDGQLGKVDLSTPQGVRALDFYIQFARAGSPYYSWNARQHYSLDAFYEGSLAMMVNYSWHYETIKQKNAKLNIGVAPLPQFAGTTPTNVANYWGVGVAKNKPYVPDAGAPTSSMTQEKWNYLRTHEAWQFLKYLSLGPQDGKITLMNGISGTTGEFVVKDDPTEMYLKKTKKPAARRDLIEKQKQDVVFGPFALGNLIAVNWYQGNAEAVEGILSEMIESVNRGDVSSNQGLSAANQRINLLSR